LRASVAIEGRSMTLSEKLLAGHPYEQVHPQSQATSPRVHEAFLTSLSTMLPPGCVPILITDAGFRGAWFRLVNRMGWYWIGRIRNRDMVSPADGGPWTGCKTLYARATASAKSLGQYDYVRNHPVSCRLVLIKRINQGRHKKGKATGLSVPEQHAAFAPGALCYFPGIAAGATWAGSLSTARAWCSS
jgi:hypothetical protein